METVAINFAVTSHFQPFIRDVTRATNAVGRLQAANSALVATNSKAASSQFAKALTESGAFYQNQVRIRSEAGKLGDTLSKRKLGLGESVNAMKQWRQEQGAITQLAQKQVRLQQSIVSGISRNAKGHITADVFTPSQVVATKNMTASAKVAAERMRIMREVAHQGAESMVNLGKNTQWAGRQMMVGLSLPIAIFAGAATAAFIKMDQQLVRIQKVYGSGLNFGDKFVEQGKMVREEATKLAAELAKTMGAAPSDTLGLMADIAATGQEGKQLTDATRETTRLSILGEVDRQQAMKATLALQSAFKQNTIELTQSIDFMNAVENQTSTSLNDLTEAIPRAGATVHNLGGGIKELSLFMTAMREGGVAAGEGANALKSGLAAMIGPTDDAQKTLESMGISIRGIADKNQGNLVGMITEFGAAFRKLGQNQKTEAMLKMFGRFQYNKMAALFNNIGVEGSQTVKVLELMGMKTQDLAKISSQELATVTESASGKFKRALNSMKMSMAEIGKGFAGPLTAVVGFFSKIMSAISNLSEGTKTFLKWGLIITALVGPVVMVTGVLLNFFGTLAKGVVALSGFFAAGKGGRWSAWTAEMSGAKAMANGMIQPFEKVTTQVATMTKAINKLIETLQQLPGVGLSAAGAMAAMTGAAAGMPVTGRNAAVTGTVAQVARANNLAGGESWNIQTMQALGPRRLAAIKMSQDIMQDPRGLTQFSGMTKKKMEALMRSAQTDEKAAQQLNQLMQKYMYSTEMQTKWNNEVASATSATKQYAANVMAQAAKLGATGTGGDQRAWRTMISGAGSMLLEDPANRKNADLRKAIPMAPTDVGGPRINTLDSTTQAGHVVSRQDLWAINQAKLNGDTVALGQIFDRLGISAKAEENALLAAAQSAETLIQAEARLAASSDRLASLQNAAAPKISLAGSPGTKGIKVNANGQASYAAGMRAFAQKQLAAAGVDAALHDQILNQARDELKNGASKAQLSRKINQILSQYVVIGEETLVRETAVRDATTVKAEVAKKVTALQIEEERLRKLENEALAKQVAAEEAAARNAMLQSKVRKAAGVVGAAGMIGMMTPAQKGTDALAYGSSALSMLGMGAMAGSMLPGAAGPWGALIGATLGVTFGIWKKFDEAAKNASKAIVDMAVAFNKATDGFNQETYTALSGKPKQNKNPLTGVVPFDGFGTDPKYGSEIQKLVDQYGKDQIEALKQLDNSQALDAAQTMYQQLINNNVPAVKAKEFINQIAVEAGKADIVLKLKTDLQTNIGPKQAFKTTLASAQQNVDSMLKGKDKLRGDDLVKTYSEAGKQYGARTAEAFQQGINSGFISNKNGNISSSIRDIVAGGTSNVPLEIGPYDEAHVRDVLGLPRDATIERVKLAYINASSKVRGDIESSVGENTRFSLQSLNAASTEVTNAVMQKLPAVTQAIAELLRTTGDGMSASSAMTLAAASSMDSGFNDIIQGISKAAGGIKGFESALQAAQSKYPQYREELSAYGTAVNNVSHQFDNLRQRVGSNTKWQASIDTSSVELARLEVQGFAVDWKALQEAPNQQTFDIIVREQRIQAGKQLIQTAALGLIPNNPQDVAKSGAADQKDAQKAAADQQKAAQKAIDADQKAMEAAQKQREKDIENVKKYYDDQIAAIQKTEDARQKAFDAEEKRNERNKTLRELQLNYMKAVASGDSFGAIGARMAMEGQQKTWGREDQNTNAKDAAQQKIDALTAERDAKTTSMQEQLDAQKEADAASIESRRSALEAQTEANQAALDAQQAQTEAATSAAVSTYEQKSAEINNILNNDLQYKDLNAKMQAIAGVLGIPVQQVRQQLEAQVGKASGLGPDIVKGIFDNFMNAPWSQLADGVAQVLLGMSPDQAFANIQLPTGSGLKPGGGFSDARGVYDSKQNGIGGTVPGGGVQGSTRLDIGTRDSTPNLFGTPLSGYSQASGGHITGPGSGTSDSIPAWLSNGEYVVRAKAVGKYGKAFLDHVNAGKFAGGGEVGGAVGAGMGSSGNATVGGSAGKAAGGKGGIAGGMFSRLIDQVIGELTAKLEQAMIPVIVSIGEMRVTMDAQAIASDQLLSIQKTISFNTQTLQMQQLLAQSNMNEMQIRAAQAMTTALQVANLQRLAQANAQIINAMTLQWNAWSQTTKSDIIAVANELVNSFVNIDYDALVKMVEAYASGDPDKKAAGLKAKLLKKADGGYISGPGTGTSDSIPALLSNGEYVVRQKSVAKYGTGLLHSINAGKFAEGGLVGTEGGIIGSVAVGISRGLNESVSKVVQSAIDVKSASMGSAGGAAGVPVTGEPLRGTAIMEKFATLFETFLGKSEINGHTVANMCLADVNDVWEMMGGAVNRHGHAYQQAEAIQAAGLMKGGTPPRGSVVWWNQAIGGGSGHAAMADGYGNFVNEWGGNTIVRTPIASAPNGFMGWSEPDAMRYAAGGLVSSVLSEMVAQKKIGANPDSWDLQARTPPVTSPGGNYQSIPIADVDLNGSSNEANIFKYLKAQGLSNAGIAGIMGNFQQEANMNPGGDEAAEGGGWNGIGLVQWSGSRHDDLVNYAASKGKHWSDLRTQLDFMMVEISNGYQDMWNTLKTIANPRDAAKLFDDVYERSGIKGGRFDYAEQWFNKINGSGSKYFAAGGPVNGRGTATSDSIPARLSNGEYVIQANSVKKYGTGFFDALNAGRFAAGGKVNENLQDTIAKKEKAIAEAKAKELAAAPKNVGLVSTISLMMADLKNFNRSGMEKEKAAKAAAADKKDGTDTATDGKAEVKNGLLYGVTAQTIVNRAKQALGTPYSRGNRAGGPGKGFDCSSFTYWAYDGYPGLMKNAWPNPGWTGTLTEEGKPRDMGAIKAGDILLHDPSSSASGHAALYIGNGQIQHSADPNQIASVDVWGGFEQARQILAYAKGGLVIPALRKGATINYDNTLANLHKGETVLTNPLTKKLNDGIDGLASGGDVSYNVSVNINKANATAAEIEQAVYSALDKKEVKAGRSRLVGARR
jgi:cell wall-associated NlpC family hydrolase